MKFKIFSSFIMIATVFIFKTKAQNLTIDNSLDYLNNTVLHLNSPALPCLEDGPQHADLFNLPTEFEKTRNHTFGSTWARSLRFRTKFNSNCSYNLGNTNQLDWNKLMFVSLTFPDVKETSIRLGWRWNLTKNKMELGLYGHIQHENSNPTPGREFLYLTDVYLNEEFKSELILSGGGIGVIVNDKGSFIKRRDVIDEGTVKTNFKRSAFFGGQECPPHNMDIDVDFIRGDGGNSATNWHNGACEKTFSRSIFYAGENLTINAARTITMSEQVYRGQYNSSGSGFSGTIPTGYSAGDEIPWFESDGERYVNVESGSTLNLNAGDKIVLKPGFHAKAGSNFKASINPSIACGNFYLRTTNNDSLASEEFLFENEFETALENTNQSVYSVANSNYTNDIKNTNLKNLLSTTQKISIYPNPNKGEFILELSNAPKGNYSLQVTDVVGRNVIQQNYTVQEQTLKQNINLQAQGKGIYFIKINSEQINEVRKVVVE